MRSKLFLLLSLLSFSSYGALITLAETGGETLSASGVDVNIPGQAKIDTAGVTANLLGTGAGVRVKKVLLFQANVYVAQSFLDASDLKLLEAAQTVEKRVEVVMSAKTKALHLTFLRDVSADKLKSAFEESLALNGADLKSENVTQFFSAINQEMKQKSTLSLVGRKDGKNQTLYLEIPGNHLSLNGPNVVDTFWKIWFGKTTDDQLRVLQLRLLGVKNVS